MSAQNPRITINDTVFEIIKATRLREGMVLKAGDVFGRIGDKQITREEQIHTVSLYNRGFPVPQVLESGELDDGQWYFTETSLGTKTFHQRFTEEYTNEGAVSDTTFESYLAVIERYTQAQVSPKNRTTISSEAFLESCIPEYRVLQNYCYFGYSTAKYQKVLARVARKLKGVTMGILQYDLNPFNILEGGIIDFELVGYGPIGYDSLMSSRWGGSWFSDYPSLYPVAYKLSSAQIQKSDDLVDELALSMGISKPSAYLQEFLTIKSAWAASDFDPPQADWPKDRLAFRRYRVNVLESVLSKYLAGETMDPGEFSMIPDDKLL